MSRISINTTRKYGFFFSLMIMIGSIVGIGIFFKNYQVFNATGGDTTLIISAWAIGGIISLMTALSFVDISRLSLNTKMPFRKWSHMFISKRYSDFVGIVALMYAYAIILPTLYYYSYSFLVQAFDSKPTLGGALVAVFVIPLGMFFINMYLEKSSVFFVKILTILKLVPLFMATLVGIFFTSHGGGFNPAETLFGTKSSSSTTLLFALPPILFTFDGFLTITNVTHKTKNAKKNIPLGIIIGMGLITCLYLLVTISQINHAAPTIQIALTYIFNNQIWTKITLFFIAISAFGISNILTLSAKVTCQSIIDDDILPFSNFYKKVFKKGNDIAGGFIMLGVSILSASIMFLCQAALVYSGTIDDLNRVKINLEARNTTLIIDEFSNYPTYLFFPIYGSIIIGNIIALSRKKLPKSATAFQNEQFNKLLPTISKTRKNVILTISVISSISIVLIISLRIFYSLLYEQIIQPLTNGNKLSPDAKLDFLVFLINIWLFQFIPFCCLYIKYKKEKKRKTNKFLTQK